MHRLLSNLNHSVMPGFRVPGSYSVTDTGYLRQCRVVLGGKSDFTREDSRNVFKNFERSSPPQNYSLV